MTSHPPATARIRLVDADTDEGFDVDVPKEHEHHWIGWHDRDRLQWGTRWGVEIARGEQGITVVDHEGERHLVPHGTNFRTWRPMRKAASAPPSDITKPQRKFEDTGEKFRGGGGDDKLLGQVKGKHEPMQDGDRWITVHPHGEDQPGVPILLRPQKDGSHRVIGGAGGKLTHVLLHHVDEPTPEKREEWKKNAAERRKGKAAKDAARKAGQSPEEQEGEKVGKDKVKKAERAAERAFLVKVRDQAGGVDEDLDDEKLGQFKTDGARNLEVARHHRRQFKQARERVRELATAKADQHLSETERAVQIETRIDEDHELGDKVRDLASTEIDLQAAEDAERTEERRANRTRTAGTKNVGDEAAEQARKVLELTEPPAEDLAHLGGRVDPTSRQALTLTKLPSEEVHRRSLQSLDDATLLHRAANGEDLEPEQRGIVQKLVDEAGVDLDDEQGLRREAARKLRRSEVLGAQAERLGDMEAEGNERGAEVALGYSDMLKGIADDAKMARQLGLTEVASTPLQAPEIAAIGDLLKDAADLREKKKAFKSMMQEVERGDYDASRRAFDLHVSAPPEAVNETEREIEQRMITNRILGISDPKREAHQEALADGHYLSLADVGLSIGKARYLDRSVVDAVGVKNAAILNRFALERDGHNPETVLKALEDEHVKGIVETSTKAIAKANDFVPGFAATVQDVGSMEQAIANLDVHEQALDDIQREVGAALGKMEALATQSQAFRDKMPAHLEIQARDQWDNTLQWLHAAGLGPGDYHLDRKNKKVRIPAAAWGKLVRKEDPSIAKTRQVVADIKGGKHDEKGWLPHGFVSRAASTFNTPGKGATRLWQPLALTSPEKYADEVRTHAGLRIADGEAPGDVLRDLGSATVLAGVRDHDTYSKALRETFPLTGADGKATKLEDHGEHFRAMAEEAVRAKHPGEAAIHAQDLNVDDPKVQEALFRTLAEQPRARAAFTPIGDMTSDDRRAIRDHFYERMGIDPKKGHAEAFQKEFTTLGKEPSKTAGTMSMFGGDTGPSPEWREWRNQALTLARKYPAEGKDLALKVLGPTPESKRSARVTPDMAKALDKVVAGRPDATLGEALVEARASLAPPLTAERRKALNDQVDGQMRVEHQQFLEAHPGANLTDVIDHLKERRALLLKHGERRSRAETGPPLNGADVSDYLAPHLHKQAIDQVKAWSAAATPWSTYVEMHGSLDHAIGALQDEIKGSFATSFAKHHEGVTGKPVRLGKSEITNRERHLFATGTPEQQDAYRAQRAEDLHALHSRDAIGRYQDMGGAGKLLEAEGRERVKDTIASQQQGGLFGGAGAGVTPPGQGGLFGAPKPPAPKAPDVKLGAGERWSLGQRGEGQIASVMPHVAKGISATGGKTSLVADANMDESRIHQQRAIRMFKANGGRIGLYGGTGFGKTGTMTGALTESIKDGSTPHGGLFVVPRAVQAQFGGEFLNFLEPGKFQWQTGEGLDHSQRVEMLANPNLHARVMTHQSFMKTAQKIVADHHGWTPEEVGPKLGAMSTKEGAQAYREAMDAHGIPPMFMAVDEFHNITHRDSSEWGALHALGRAATHPINATKGVFASATPHKNDTSELQSAAALVDPENYGDKDKFLAAFGSGIAQNPDSIRRELAHLTYSASIPPEGVERVDMENPQIEAGRKVAGVGPLPMLPEHQKLVDEVDKAYQTAVKARAAGKVDVAAVKRLASAARFEGVPEEKHKEVAEGLHRSLAILRDSAMRRAVELAPPEHNTKLQAMTAVIKHDLEHGTWKNSKTGAEVKGRPAIVFANSEQAVKMITEHLGKHGIRAHFISGSTPTEDLPKILSKFGGADGGPRQADVLVGTASIEAGLNAQWAKAVHHFDVPMTEKAENQRNGRAYRQKQLGDVEAHSWHLDTPYDRNARMRLRRKAGLANVFQTNLGNLDETGLAASYQSALDQQHQGIEPEAAIAAAK